MEEAVCKISFGRYQERKGNGTGFFCEIENYNFPMKYCLFT